MTNWTRTGAVLVTLLLAAGCSRSMPSFESSGPAPLTPAPRQRVAVRKLPPPPPPAPAASQNSSFESETDVTANETDQNASSDNSASQETQVASVSSGPISRNSVLGAYKVTTTGGNCQIILSLTKWTGGYRAASRGCPGAVADVSAWDVSGNQVVLKDSGGSNVANLNSSGGSRYEGRTKSGQQISLYR
ncbi:protease inhibitor Inh/omp19 family protein [Aurantimonas sp. A3-2-R12]|uniref:protease inhibitor Inh/omp19 family protein n=1 Tax=Aurantimonas sp. A3-2-R12 TaxID=3114362 RepID=UPI002E182B8B|nr:protease inhibitor Inh/omp19 family protein [Aurantimonas sp. A3-2-R12]